MKQAEESQIEEFERFAASLRTDHAAVKAALVYSWSNGQVEGQVGRLKMIKRQMYGTEPEFQTTTPPGASAMLTWDHFTRIAGEPL